MFDKYILLNQKQKNFQIFYLGFALLLSFIFILVIFKLKFTPYFVKKAEIKFIENNYYLKLNVNVSDLELISSINRVIIDGNGYFYKIFKIEYNNGSKIVVYLDVFNLSDKYKVSNNILLIKLLREWKSGRRK